MTSTEMVAADSRVRRDGTIALNEIALAEWKAHLDEPNFCQDGRSLKEWINTDLKKYILEG